MSQDHTNDLYTVIPYKIYGLQAVHYKFAITKSTTIAVAAAPSANGDLAVAAFIMVWHGISNNNVLYTSLHTVSVAAGQLFTMVKKQQAGMGSEEYVGVFHSLNMHAIK